MSKQLISHSQKAASNSQKREAQKHGEISGPDGRKCGKARVHGNALHERDASESDL
jgi:hypothetical protein